MKKNVVVITSVIIFLLFFTFIVPLLINKAYNMGCGKFITDWGAAEALVYYGAVLGGLATLAAVLIAIWYENKNRNDDKKRDEKQREADRMHSIEQREEDRKSYEKQRDEDKKYNDEQREKDRKWDKKEKKYRCVSGLLFDSLNNLDCSYLLSFKKHCDEQAETLLGRQALSQERYSELVSPYKLSELIEKANTIKNMGIYFTSDERKLLHEALYKLRNYADEYISLLLRLSRNCEQPVGGIIEFILEEIETLYNNKYKKLVIIVQESMDKFEQYLFKS